MICRKYFILGLVALFAIGISSDELPKSGTYHALIQRQNKRVCGGALISYRHVLTAAKCLVGHGGRYYKEGLLIITNLARRAPSDASQEHSAAFVEVHPHFYKGSARRHPRNDIAVITLKPSVFGGSAAKPIELPSNNNIDSRQLAHFFGRGEYHGMDSSIGKQLNLHIGERWYCEGNYHIYHSQLCTKNLKDGGTCWGDEGGPLEHHSTVIGILSYRIGRCNDGRPEVYTRVAAYTNFITEAMWKH